MDGFHRPPSYAEFWPITRIPNFQLSADCTSCLEVAGRINTNAAFCLSCHMWREVHTRESSDRPDPTIPIRGPEELWYRDSRNKSIVRVQRLGVFFLSSEKRKSSNEVRCVILITSLGQHTQSTISNNFISQFEADSAHQLSRSSILMIQEQRTYVESPGQ